MKRCPIKMISAVVALGLAATVLHAQTNIPKLYAQELVDRIVAEHPELDKVSIHSYPPGAAASTSCIIASKDITKPGDPDDQEDFDALTNPKPNFYYSKDQGLYKGLFQLLDVSGLPVGSLTLAYKYTSKDDEAKQAEAMNAIRDGLKIYIPSQASLFETGRIPKKIFAQTLVDYVLANHPELVRISIHVAAPGAPVMNTYVIAGKDMTKRHLPMIGEMDDAEDFLPLTSGKSSFFFVKERGFYKGLLPMYDVTGQSIGVLLLGINYTSKEDEPKFMESMTLIRDLLKVHTPNRAALFQSAE